MARIHPAKSVEANFVTVYPKLVRSYFRRGRRLVAAHAGNEDLHQFRIRTKRLRYVTELYASAFPNLLRSALVEWRGVQEVLGNLQDQCMVAAYFEKRLLHVRTPLRQTEYLRVLHRATMRQNRYRNAFFRRWSRLERTGFERRLLAAAKQPMEMRYAVRSVRGKKKT